MTDVIPRRNLSSSSASCIAGYNQAQLKINGSVSVPIRELPKSIGAPPQDEGAAMVDTASAERRAINRVLGVLHAKGRRRDQVQKVERATERGRVRRAGAVHRPE
jgi:hypothetical protein